MQKIPCKEIAEKILNSLKSQSTPRQILAAILIGSTSSPQVAQSISFVRQKEKIAKELGIDFRTYEFQDSISQSELIQEIGGIVSQKSIGGVIVQLPLPEKFNAREILNIIPVEKDIDVLSERAFNNFRNGVNPVLPPPVEVVIEILKFTDSPIHQSAFALIGTGNLIGRPIAEWLKQKATELAILNSKTENIKEELKIADIIISGAGKANLFSAEDLKNDAVVIDFGYSMVNGKISGDFDASSIENCKLKIENLKYTPTPGGTGPILVAKIMENFYKLNK